MRIGKPNILGYENVTVVYKPRPGDDQYPWVREDGIGRRWHSSDIHEVEYASEFKLGDDGPRTGVGTSLELAIAETVAIAIAKHCGEPVGSFFIAGHKHEGLPKGSISVAWEGSYGDWSTGWMHTGSAEGVAEELDVWFEPINGCILAVHPRY